MAQNNDRKRRVGMGQTARWEVHGTGAFTTTGATVTVNVPMGRVEHFEAFAIGTPAADENLSANNTVSGTVGNNDAAIVGTNGVTPITLTRTGASKTSGLKFFWRAVGK
jgi:hypothetical protein